jgi:hypothetical protein
MATHTVFTHRIHIPIYQAGERLVARFRKVLFGRIVRADIAFYDGVQVNNLLTPLNNLLTPLTTY